MKIIVEKRKLFSFIFGLFAALPLCFDALGFLSFASFIPFFLLLIFIKDDKEIRLYPVFLFFFFGYYVCAYTWFFELYPLSFTGMSKFEALTVIILAGIFLPLFQSSVFSLAAPIYRMIKRRIKGEKKEIILILSLISVFGWFQTFTWMGVPWASPAIALYRAPVFIESASLFGAHFVSALILYINISLSYAIYHFAVKKSKRASFFALFAVILFSSNSLFGTVCLCITPKCESKVTVALLQANVSSIERWTAADSYMKYCDMAKDVAEKYSPDLIVMPESAIVAPLWQGSALAQSMCELSKTIGSDIIVGAFYDEEIGDDFFEYTSMFLFTKDGEMSDEIYSKRKLVPFGEFVPYSAFIEKFIPPLADLLLGGNELTEGEGAQIIHSDVGDIGALICYDTLFPSKAKESVRAGADYLVVASNDSWFGTSRALYHHHAQSVLRAIESGKYTAVCANTGISAVISPRGEILSETDICETEYIIYTIGLRDNSTLYSHIGDVYVYICILYILVLPFWDKISGIIKRKVKR